MQLNFDVAVAKAGDDPIRLVCVRPGKIFMTAGRRSIDDWPLMPIIIIKLELNRGTSGFSAPRSLLPRPWHANPSISKEQRNFPISFSFPRTNTYMLGAIADGSRLHRRFSYVPTRYVAGGPGPPFFSFIYPSFHHELLMNVTIV